MLFKSTMALVGSGHSMRPLVIIGCERRESFFESRPTNLQPSFECLPVAMAVT